MQVRPASAADAASLARIYNEAIDDRVATFETERRSEYDVLGWFDGVHPVVVVVDDTDEAIAFARASAYSPRACYRGVFELGIYVDRRARRRGAGSAAVRDLVTRSRDAGAWKLVGRVFVENHACRALMGAVGFREVGVYYRHGKLDGKWRDVVAFEKFLAPLGGEGSIGPPPPRGSRVEILEALSGGQEQGLLWARDHLLATRRRDLDLLEALVTAFFASSAHDASTRARFLDLFRAYASISTEAALDVPSAIFARLSRASLSDDRDRDAFYEAVFVVKRIARASDLSAHVPQLVAWTRAAIDLPHSLRGRISAGNVASLLMTLASSACETEEQRREIGEIAARAKARLRVEPPVSLRPSLPPPPPEPAAPPPEAPPPRSRKRTSVKKATAAKKKRARAKK